MTELMPCIKDKSPEEVLEEFNSYLEVFNSYLMREDVKRLIVCKDGKEVVYVKQVSAQPERKKGEWIPFKQEQNPETGRWEFVDPPEDGQHILITVNLPGHEPVQDDYWYWDVYGHLDSGYTPCDEAIAWMSLPEPYRGEQDEAT